MVIVYNEDIRNAKGCEGMRQGELLEKFPLEPLKTFGKGFETSENRVY